MREKQVEQEEDAKKKEQQDDERKQRDEKYKELRNCYWKKTKMSIAEIADCQQSADSQTVEQLSDVCEQQVALQKNSGKVDTAHTLACKGDIAEAKRAISTQIQQTDSPNCKPYTTPDGTKSGIACKQEDGTWKIKTSQ